jgi:hypothetical protein
MTVASATLAALAVFPGRAHWANGGRQTLLTRDRFVKLWWSGIARLLNTHKGRQKTVGMNIETD